VLGLSRGMVREALQVLEDNGRVWRRVGLGTFVIGHPHLIGSSVEPPAAVISLTDILKARTAGEPIVTRLSAQRAAHAEIVMIEHHVAKADKARDWAEWEKWDDLLHRVVVEARLPYDYLEIVGTVPA